MSDLITLLTDLFSFDQEHPLLFTQFNFWAFFLLVFAGFCAIVCRQGRGAAKMPLKCTGSIVDRMGGRLTMRNGYLFFVSLFFYFRTSGLFVLLLIFSTLLGYFLGIAMDKR